MSMIDKVLERLPQAVEYIFPYVEDAMNKSYQKNKYKRLEKIAESLPTRDDEQHTQSAMAPSPHDTAPALQKEELGACVTCIKDHLSTCAAALSEALRFARDKGTDHYEVISRLSLCEDELNIGERIDMAPHKLNELESEAKQLMEEYLPKLRELRHKLNETKTVSQLEDTAAYAQSAKLDFRARWLALPIKAIGEASAEDRERILERAKEMAKEE